MRVGAVTFVAMALLLGACGSTTSTTPADPTPSEPPGSEAASSAPEASAAQSEMPSGAPSEAEAPLPGDVVLENLSEFSETSGTVRFQPSAGGSVDIAVTMTSREPQFNAYGLLVVPGSCADQPDEPNFDDAVINVTIPDDSTDEVAATVALTEILASPHAILISNAPGNASLACGDIE